MVDFSYWPLYLSEVIICCPNTYWPPRFQTEARQPSYFGFGEHKMKWRNRSRLPEDEIIELLTKLKAERNKCKPFFTHKILLDGDQLSVAHNVPATIRLFQPDSEAIFCLVLNHSQESFILS